MMRFRKATRAAALALALPALALTTAQVSAQEQEQEQQRDQAQQQQEQQEPTLAATARQTEELSLFVQALERTGMTAALDAEGPFTVFAPTNDALREYFSEEELNALKGEGEIPAEMKDEVAHVLRAHIVTGEVTADRLQGGQTVRNVLGNDLAISAGTSARAMARTEAETDRPEREERQAEREQAEAEMQPASRDVAELQVEDAGIVRTDIRASNGVIHVIDAVIEPGPMKDKERAQEQSEQRSEPPAKDAETESPPPTG